MQQEKTFPACYVCSFQPKNCGRVFTAFLRLGEVFYSILSNDWLLDATCGSIMAVKLVKCNMTLYCYFIGIAFTALLPKYGPGQPSLDKVLVAQFCKHLVDVLHFAVCVKNPSTSNIFALLMLSNAKVPTSIASRSYVVIHIFFLCKEQRTHLHLKEFSTLY